MTAHLLRGDARVLPLASGSVQAIVTSPPYFGLRSYGGQASVWGGLGDCEHEWTALRGAKVITGGFTPKQVTNAGSYTAQKRPNNWSAKQWDETHATAAGGFQPAASCSLCDAMRVELGSEPDPQSFVAHLVEVFRECWRVLRDDGVCFVNMGDSYAGSGKGPSGHNGIGDQDQRQGFTGNGGMHRKRLEAGVIGNAWVPAPKGIRQKSLMLVPERLAIALSDDGWIVRQVLIWAKNNPMPESVRDRWTTAHEYVLMLVKQPRYYFDQEAIREPLAEASIARLAQPYNQAASGYRAVNGAPDGDRSHLLQRGANGRSVWNLNGESYPGQHFATFPKEIPRRCILAATSEYGACAACGAAWARANGGQSASVLGEAVRLRREELGLTREQLAQKAGKGSNNVWDWEVGGHIPNGKHWDSFAAALDLTLTRDQFVEQAEYITTGRQDGPKRQAADSEFGVYRPYTERKLRLPAQDKGWAATCKCGPAAGVRPCIVADPFSGSGTTCFVAASMGRIGIGVELSAEYTAQARYGRLAQEFLPLGVETERAPTTKNSLVVAPTPSADRPAVMFDGLEVGT